MNRFDHIKEEAQQEAYEAFEAASTAMLYELFRQMNELLNPAADNPEEAVGVYNEMRRVIDEYKAAHRANGKARSAIINLPLDVKD